MRELLIVNPLSKANSFKFIKLKFLNCIEKYFLLTLIKSFLVIFYLPLLEL